MTAAAASILQMQRLAGPWAWTHAIHWQMSLRDLVTAFKGQDVLLMPAWESCISKAAESVSGSLQDHTGLTGVRAKADEGEGLAASFSSARLLHINSSSSLELERMDGSCPSGARSRGRGLPPPCPVDCLLVCLVGSILPARVPGRIDHEGGGHAPPATSGSGASPGRRHQCLDCGLPGEGGFMSEKVAGLKRGDVLGLVVRASGIFGGRDQWKRREER